VTRDMNLASAESLRCHLAALRQEREQRKTATGKRARRNLAVKDREVVLSKTGGRCHICGGEVRDAWQADHILSHSGGGQGDRDNYLAAHALCNNYRWDYLPEEFQVILKLGVWARTLVEKDTILGKQIAEAFAKHERRRVGRRKSS
jgi:hypothetical protein